MEFITRKEIVIKLNASEAEDLYAILQKVVNYDTEENFLSNREVGVFNQITNNLV